MPRITSTTQDASTVRPTVSVCITTYNHEKCIRQAIGSVLSQQTDFKLELLVGEDNSSDSTGDIVRGLALQHPTQIRAFYNDRDNVLYIGGHATGRRNLINLLSHATGKYIAILDGDDYWTDTSKIQMQVEFMEQSPNVAMCFHDAQIVDEIGQDSGVTFCNGRIMAGELAIEKMIRANMVQIGTALFRRDSILPPRIAETIRTYDWLLVFIASQHGTLHFIDKTLSAYRVHPAGIWQKMNRVEQANAEIDILWELNQFLEKKYHGAFCESIADRKCFLHRTGQVQDSDDNVSADILLHYHEKLEETKREAESFRASDAELRRIKGSLLWRIAKRVRLFLRVLAPRAKLASLKEKGH